MVKIYTSNYPICPSPRKLVTETFPKTTSMQREKNFSCQSKKDMRKMPLLFLGLVFCLSLAGLSCQKSSGLNDRLAGTWELYKQEGGFIGTLFYPPGNGNNYQFKSDGSFTRSAPASTASGNYQLQRANLLSTDQILTLTWSGNAAVARDSVRLTDSLLIFLFRGSCCDIPDIVYRRIQ
jgi:hypothetical protein